MSKSHRNLGRGFVLVISVAAIALLLDSHAGGQQKKGGQKYLDKWVKVPFCGSVTITRNWSGKGTIKGGTTVESKDYGQLTASITGPKDKISKRTGRAAGFFLEGMVNTTYKFHEVMSADGTQLVWDLDATGQKRHSYEPGAYDWTELQVNRGKGRYRFRPPSGNAKGTGTFSSPGGTTTFPETIDAWHFVRGPVHSVERSFDPETGTITGSANFTWPKPLIAGDIYGIREGILPDNLPRRPSEEENMPAGKMEEAAKLVAQALPTAPVTFQVNWNLNLDTGACKRTVRIVYPRESKEFVFGHTFDKPENLYIEGSAEADPQSYERNIYPWDVSNIEGSTKEIKSLGPNCTSEEDATPVKGRCVIFRFKGLPKDNAQFGEKTVTADIAQPVHIKVFFPKHEKTNPEGKDPNWFYYWKQGAVPDLDKFEYVDEPESKVEAQFIPPNVLQIFDGASLCHDAISIELFERLPGFENPYEGMGYKRGGYRDGGFVSGRVKMEGLKENKLIRVFRTIDIEEHKGVDFCHAVVLHELSHKRTYDSFHSYTSTGFLKDTDGDWLPDEWEIWTKSRYQFDPKDSDTHFMRFQWFQGYDFDGDDEVLAFEAERYPAARHDLDWANPGKQSQNKDECNEPH